MTIVVKPITKDHITITLGDGQHSLWFNLPNGGAEIIVLDKNATECTRLAAAPPEPGYKLCIEVPDVTTINVFYEEVNGTTR